MREKRRAQFLKDVAQAARQRRRKPRWSTLAAEHDRSGKAAWARGDPQRSTMPNDPAQRRALQEPSYAGRHPLLEARRPRRGAGAPHNIRRLLSGEEEQRHSYARGRELWDRMTLAEQREFLSMLPPHVARKSRLVLHAAIVWEQVRDQGFQAVSRFLRELGGMMGQRRRGCDPFPRADLLCPRSAAREVAMVDKEKPADTPNSPRQAFRSKLRARAQAVLDRPDVNHRQKAEAQRALANLDALGRATRRPTGRGADAAEAMTEPETRSAAPLTFSASGTEATWSRRS